MARTQEPDTGFDPRHRVVGAIILVTLAVLLLPLILDEHSPLARSQTDILRSSENGLAKSDNASKTVIKTVSIRKPAENEKKITRSQDPKKVAVKSDADHNPKVVIRKVSLSKAKQSTETESVKSAEDKKDSIKQKPATLPSLATRKIKATPKLATKPLVAKPHWAVQVGTFSSPGNVRRLDKQLKEHGYSVMLKDVNLKQGTAVRVRVGPYSTRGSADRAQGKIKQEIGVKGVVVAGP